MATSQQIPAILVRYSLAAASVRGVVVLLLGGYVCGNMGEAWKHLAADGQKVGGPAGVYTSANLPAS